MHPFSTLSLALTISIASCAKPPAPASRIDLSSDEAAATSLARIRDTLSPEEQARFSSAISAVVRAALANDPATKTDPARARRLAIAAINGKTATEVLASANGVPPPGNTANN